MGRIIYLFRLVFNDVAGNVKMEGFLSYVKQILIIMIIIVLALTALAGCNKDNAYDNHVMSVNSDLITHYDTTQSVNFTDRFFDFGKVNPGSSYTAMFEFYNDTSGTIEILQVVPECTCSISILGPMLVKPGQKTTILITYYASKKTGWIRQEIDLLYKTGIEKKLTITIAADIDPFVVVEPNIVTFKQRYPLPQTVTIRSVDNIEFALQDVKSDMFTAEFNSDQKDTVHTLTLSMDSGVFVVNPVGVIRCLVSHPRCNVVEIDYNIEENYVISERGIKLINLKPGQTTENSLTIRSNLDKDFIIGNSYSKNGFMEIKKASKLEGGYSVTVQTTAPPKIPGRQRLFTDVLTIEVEDASSGPVEVKVGVRGYYKRN